MSKEAAQNLIVNVLRRGDLIEDRELASVDEDRLAHDGIVEQLVALVTTVPTPSNIALYGPWGSGKSGIANLLKDRIDRSEGRRFVRFDAFKYADVPLRRNFISAIASGLEMEDSRFHGDLYAGRIKSQIEIPALDLAKLLMQFLKIMLGFALVMGGLLALVAWARSGDFGTQYGLLLRQALMAGLLPASLLAALISFASRKLNVERSLAKPESDEQFEALFKSLVAASKAKRLVIFVDELDRCSPDEVVDTLDTVRTFLGLDRCVFIIAADQNVLEEALTSRAKQATPSDETNPYYSTGSAYLDKVFQYQVALPPLLTQKVSSFAKELVAGRHGVWAEINIEYVLGVLIPTHVASPRRVKHLLNTFALTYRLAEQRHHSGLLAVDPKECSDAIARLVCLRVEFPLFARHLEIDARLPELVLRLIRDPDAEMPPGTSAHAERLAREYAMGGAAPASMLVRAAAVDEQEEDPSGDSEDGGGDSGVSGGATLKGRTIDAHNKQLQNYLRRTKQVSGPNRDLVYLQTTGTGFGLDGGLAVAIEHAAEDRDLRTLRQRLEGISDPADQAAVLDLLVHQIRVADTLSGTNTAHSFLRLIELVPELPVNRVLDTVATAVVDLYDDGRPVLDEDSIDSAWNLVRSESGTGAENLRRRVVLAVCDPKNDLSADTLLGDAAIAVAAGEAFSNYIIDELTSGEWAEVLEKLGQAPDEDFFAVLSAVGDGLAIRCRDLVDRRIDWEKSQKSPPAAGRTVAAETEPAGVSGFLEDLADAAIGREASVQHAVLRILFAVGRKPARDAVHHLIGVTAPIVDRDLAGSVLNALRSRAIDAYPKWLSVIDVDAISSANASQVRTLLEKVVQSEPAQNVAAEAISALAPFVRALPEAARPDLTDTVISALEGTVDTSEAAEERSRGISIAYELTGRDLADAGRITQAIVATLAPTLAQPLSSVGTEDPLYRFVVRDGSNALRLADGVVDHNQVEEIVSAAALSPWLDTVARAEVSLELAAAVSQIGLARDDLPTVDAIGRLLREHGAMAVRSAILWVQITAPGPDDLAAVLEAMWVGGLLSEAFADAARSIERTWTAEQHRSLLDQYLSDPSGELPADIRLRALGLSVAPEGEVADLLCSRFDRATNNVQRQDVLTLWWNAEVSGEAARKRLFESVIFGLLSLGADGKGNARAVDLALTALERLGNPLPRGMKRALGDRVQAAVAGNKDLASKAERVLRNLGFPAKSKGLFGRKGRLDPGS